MAQSKGKVPSSEGKADQASEDMKREIICPLTLEATTKINKNPKAVNYGVTWEATIAVDGQSEPGVWYSSQKGRGHSSAFDQLLNDRKESGEATWEEDGYYFSQEEGKAAREKYEQMVLDGETTITVDGSEETITVKANKRSWENKHQHFTNVSWEELVEKLPEIYKSTTAKAEVADEVEMEGEESMMDEDSATEEVVEEEVIAAVSDDEEDEEDWDDEDEDDEYDEV